ncbi:glycosyltransferase family 2 protein [Profundibacterium mesophilum]|uniref:Glycosyltransferase epsH n=1 Tax=Profundibacterium mesophilum KAUST100406-0324 TaxID=1037889 RepID=A0A921TB12_9RHOB|nr:glycosyltransferase family 2 protein [Profundibacterium mesophilum]KAF0674595.1 putative glycosyltransferase epsH [Profundibacterium mesophilum KAUST100406-0324]
MIPASPTQAATPAVTLIVPVHDVQEHVGACIASIRAQGMTDFEVIVIDDGSTDDSHRAAVTAIGSDPRFRVIRQSNAGLSAARNVGLSAARGSVIGFVDSDDRIAPDFLERMCAALERSGADWVACAVRSCHPDGSSDAHSAIHGAPVPEGPPKGRLMPLGDWCQIIRHYPSAWNKLYRRTLIEGLRYDEGTWFEDHAFYYRAACRTHAIMHLPQALYWQTRGRPGQITGADDDRVFEQFGVLETLHGIMASSGRPKAREGFERIASRLLFERSTVLADPARRAAFAAAGRDYLARRDMRYAPDWDPGISRLWGLEMAGACAVTVIVAASDAAPDALRATLRALEDPRLPNAEILCLGTPPRSVQSADPRLRWDAGDGETGRGDAILRAMARADGALVTVLQPGDLLPAAALHARAEAMLRLDADLGYSDFHFGPRGDLYHDGLHVPGLAAQCPAWQARRMRPVEIAALHLRPLGKVFAASALRGLLGDERNAPQTWTALVIAAAARAERAVRFEDGMPHAAAQAPPDAHPGDPARLARQIALIDVPGGRLPAGWRRRLYLRALREALSGHSGRLARLGLALRYRAAWRAEQRLQAMGALDPDIGPRLAWLFTPPRPRGMDARDGRGPDGAEEES